MRFQFFQQAAFVRGQQVSMDLVYTQICTDLLRGIQAVAGQHDHCNPSGFEPRDRILR